MLDVASCGICGSDLHAKDHADELAGSSTRPATRTACAVTPPTIFGHEFSGVVAERGAKAAKAFKIGTRVVSFPMVRSHGGSS